MKKTMKRFLTAALAMAMVLTMVMVPVSAANMITVTDVLWSHGREETDFDLRKTFTIMDDNMSTVASTYITQDYHLYNLDGKPERDKESNEYKAYHNGTHWVKTWATDSGAFTVGEDGFKITANTSNAKGDTSVEKYPFKNIAAYEKSDVKFTYDFKTYDKYVNSTEEGVTQTTGNIAVRGIAEDKFIFSYEPEHLVLNIAGSSESNYADSCVLNANSDYKAVFEFLYDKNNGCYDLNVVVTDSLGGEVKTSFFDNWLEKEQFTGGITLRYQRVAAALVEAPLVAFKNVKIENTVAGHIINFGDAKYVDDTVMIDQAADGIGLSPVALDNADYISGARWSTEDAAYGSTGMTINGDYLNVTGANGDWWTHSRNSIVRRFEGVDVDNDEMLKISATIKIANSSSEYRESDIIIGKDSIITNEAPLKLFSFSYNPSRSGNKYVLNTLFKNSINDAQGWTIDNCGEIIDADDAITNIIGVNTDTEFVFTLAPKTDGEGYTATTTYGDITKSIELTDEDAAAYNTFGIRTDSFKGKDGGFAMKNLKVEKLSSVRNTALVEGTNTLYLPIENVTGHEATYAIVAAVCDKTTDEQKDFFICQYTDHSKTMDNLAIDVEISDPATEYVKFYVFNGYDSLVPYTTPLSLGE